MLKPKSRSERVSYWTSLSDTALLNVELTTETPDKLEGIVFALPQSATAPHVEFKYDMRRTESEKVRCIHCNTAHLAGYVMNQDGARFLVGHICGGNIYGEDFKQYTNDFEEAADRRETLRRVRDAQALVEPFCIWLKEISESDVFMQYQRIHTQFYERMEWLTLQLKWHTNNGGCLLAGHKLPPTFFNGYENPHREFLEIAPAIMGDAMLLVGKLGIHKDAKATFGRLQAKLSRLEIVIKHLSEPLDFFQPATLKHVCKWATENDDPKKRKYNAATMRLTCHHDRGPISVKVPKGYKVPSLATLQHFRAALAGFQVK